MKAKANLLCVVMALTLLLAACAPAATPAPTAAPVTAPTVAPTIASAAPATEAPTNTSAPAPTATAVPATPTTAATAAPTAVAQIASGLQQKNHLLICSDFPYPPMEFFDENGNPQGLDVELGNEIGNRLGLQVVWVNSVFDTIIAAVTSGKCDIIMSSMNITADRNKQVSMIPYFQAGQSFVVQKGNPHNIKDQTDLCGQPVAAESGTTEAFYLGGTDAYKGKGLKDICEKAGKKGPVVTVTQKDTDALQSLLADKVFAYSSDTQVAAYYIVQHPDQFELVSQVVDPALIGINMPCGESDCTKATLTPVGMGVQAALKSMMDDGTYLKILDKWNLGSGAIKP